MAPTESGGEARVSFRTRLDLEWSIRWCKIGPSTKHNTKQNAGCAKWKVAEPEL